MNLKKLYTTVSVFDSAIECARVNPNKRQI